MNHKKGFYALITILGWTLPFALIGWIFEALPTWITIGLVIGGAFALIAELIGNWLARTLSLQLLVGTLVGIWTIWFIFGQEYIHYTASFDPALGAPPPGQQGPAFPNIVGMIEWVFYTAAMVVASAIGAFIGGLLGVGSGLIGSLIMRLR